MVKRKNKGNKPLRESEEESLHLSEFSQGKPYEFSLNVLENKSLIQAEKKPSIFKRLLTRDRGSAQGLPDTPYVSDGLDDVTGFKGKPVQSSDSHAFDGAEVSDKGASDSLGGFEQALPANVPSTSSYTPSYVTSPKAFLDDDSQQEIQKRQTRRRISRIVSIVFAVVVAVALIAIGANYLYQKYQEQQSNVSLLQTSFDYMAKTDKTLVEIDTFFQEKFDDSTISRAETLLANIPEAQKQLTLARDYATRANEGLDASTKDKEAAEYALNSIAAREIIFSVSEERLNEDIAAKKALDAIEQAQANITEANSLLIQAAKVVSHTTADKVNTSTQYTTSARELITKAQSGVEEAKSAYPKADFSILEAYMEKRIEAADAALASNAAILIQDKQVAEEANARYNEADADSATLAEKLSSSFDKPVVEAYQAAIKPLAERYDAARSDIGRNDSYLRSYLGIKTAS